MNEIAIDLNENLIDMIEDHGETSLTLIELIDEIDTYIGSIPDSDKKTAAASILQGFIASIIENIVGAESEDEDDE